MDALYPTVTISIPAQHEKWKLWELTVNPMLWLPDNPRLFTGAMAPRYEVWVELVLLHREADAQFLPEIAFEFNDAFDFDEEGPPEADTLPGEFATPFNQLYYDYWHLLPRQYPDQWDESGFSYLRPDGRFSRDPLTSAYGQGSTRVVRLEHKDQLRDLAASRGWLPSVTDRVIYTDECKGGLAFMRRRYAETGDPFLRCYPCRWTARSERRASGDHVVTLGGLALHECHPRHSIQGQVSRAMVEPGECISLWYCFPYTGRTGQQACTPSHGLYSFALGIAVEDKLILPAGTTVPASGEQLQNIPCSVNLFPRVAAEFEVSDACDPPIQPVPRLDFEPVIWQREGMSVTRPYRSPRSKQSWSRVHPQAGARGDSADHVAGQPPRADKQREDETAPAAGLRSLRIHCDLIDRYHSSSPALWGFILGVFLAIVINVLSPTAVERIWDWVSSRPTEATKSSEAGLAIGVLTPWISSEPTEAKPPEEALPPKKGAEPRSAEGLDSKSAADAKVAPESEEGKSTPLPSWFLVLSALACVILAVMMHDRFFPGRATLSWLLRRPRRVWRRLGRHG
jgi:hypothetical protein